MLRIFDALGNSCIVLSVPFSSGQGMLQPEPPLRILRYAYFQSPFHRGKECYRGVSLSLMNNEWPFSPLFIGARNVTQSISDDHDSTSELSVPFSSGQGMLHRASPTIMIPLANFQSPFHRGKECYCQRFLLTKVCYVLSVPFSSGQGMLL